MTTAWKKISHRQPNAPSFVNDCDSDNRMKRRRIEAAKAPKAYRMWKEFPIDVKKFLTFFYSRRVFTFLKYFIFKTFFYLENGVHIL